MVEAFIDSNIDVFLEPNRQNLTSPYHTESLLANATESLKGLQNKVKELLTPKSDGVGHTMLSEKAPAVVANRREIDNFTILIAKLKELRALQEKEAQESDLSVEAVTEKARQDFAAHWEHVGNKHWEGTQLELVLDDASRRSKEAMEKLKTSPEDSKAKAELTYWQTFQNLAKAEQPDVKDRVEERYKYLFENYDGVTGTDELLAQRDRAELMWQIMLMGGVGVVVVVLFLLWRRRGAQ